MDPIVLILKDDILPEEKGKAYKVRKMAPGFGLFEDQKLYKYSFSGPYVLCIHPEVVKWLLKKLHEKQEMASGRHWLLHQMGWSWATNKH